MMNHDLSSAVIFPAAQTPVWYAGFEYPKLPIFRLQCSPANQTLLSRGAQYMFISSEALVPTG